MATTNLSDVFLGSEQSKYAGIALFITILIICLAILFTSSKIPIEQRIVFVIFILIITLPSILMTLFELTCIVTGGNYNTRWWCWALAWVLAVMIIFYCIMIILSLFISMTTYDMANDRIAEDIANNKVDETPANTNANNYAKNIMKTYEQEQEQEYQPHSQTLPPSQPSAQQLKQPQMPPQPQRQQQQQMQTEQNHLTSLSQQYQPPVPPQQQSPVPQQSQHQRPQQSAASSASSNGSYTGFDSSDNLAPLDADFSPMKEPVRRPVNIHSESRMSDNVEPYTDSNMDMFSSF
jgi:hypothetical protein